MSESSPEEKAFQAACRQVGEFLFHFSLLEREMGEGIGKLLGIGEGVVDVVTANMDFYRKMRVLFSAELAKAKMPDKSRKKLLEETWSAIMALNDERKIVAHMPFSPGKNSGVVLHKAVAEKELKVEDIKWSADKFKATKGRADKGNLASTHPRNGAPRRVSTSLILVIVDTSLLSSEMIKATPGAQAPAHHGESRSPSRAARTTGAIMSGKTAGRPGRLPVRSRVTRKRRRMASWPRVTLYKLHIW